MNTARCLLSEAKVNHRFWPEVIKTAAYLKNRILANTLENKTLHEILTGKKLNISNLRLYGSRVFVRVPEEKRKSKWDRKADLEILLGYNSVGYRILINNKIVIARHVDVIEENANLIRFGGNEDNNSMNDLSDTDNLNKTENLIYSVKDNSIPEDINVISPNRKVDCNREEYELRKSERVKKRPKRYGNNTVYSSCIYVNIVSADSPLSFEDALKGRESELWKQAIDREISCLKKK